MGVKCMSLRRLQPQKLRDTTANKQSKSIAMRKKPKVFGWGQSDFPKGFLTYLCRVCGRNSGIGEGTMGNIIRITIGGYYARLESWGIDYSRRIGTRKWWGF